VIQVSTHLFGSTDGYQTLAQSADVTESEERALCIFGFGSPQTKQEIDQLVRHPSVAGRLLPSGRFAITRLFPGEPDVAGRDTVERRSILFTAHDWTHVLRCDIESLLQDAHVFDRQAFTSASGHSVHVNDSQDLLPCAGDLERRLYDILLSTPPQNSCSLVADEQANRRGLLQLLKLLPNKEARQLSWGLGLFAATPGVRIATASNSAATGPNARWSSLTGPLRHAEKVATLGMASQLRTSFSQGQHAKEQTQSTAAQRIFRFLPWIVLGLLVISSVVVFALSKLRTSATTQNTTQNINSTTPPVSQQNSIDTHTQPVSPIVQPTALPIETPVAAPVETPVETPTATPIETPAAMSTAAPTALLTPEVAAPTSTINLKEPVNAKTNDCQLWFQARKIWEAAQSAPDASLPIAEGKDETQKIVNELIDIEQKIISQAKEIKLKKPLLSNKAGATMTTQITSQMEAEQMCQAAILLLAECDILSAKEAIQKKQVSPLNSNKRSGIMKQIDKTDLPASMEIWVDKIGPLKRPKASIQIMLDLQLRELILNKKFPINPIVIPNSR
jgi:hypothetical protein